MSTASDTAACSDTLLARAEELLYQRDLHASKEAFDEAERAGAEPDRCSAGRWQVFMLDGLFENAWRESDVIHRRGEDDAHRFWHGDAIDGRRVIVRSLHGLGDAVQMFRYAGLLRERAAHVVFEVAPSMLPLAPYFRSVEHVITWGAQAPLRSPDWELQVEITELPYLFRTTADQLPIATEYLHVPESLIDRTSRAMGPTKRLRVGLVWTCGEWNPSRNVPLCLLRDLLHNADVEFWNLQGGDAAAEADGLRARYQRELCEGLLPLTALIANLDLVITADTLAAHLAGALNRPGWVMLEHAADWRWMQARDRSPWYPSLRLVRQQAPGDWESVVRRIRLMLEDGLTSNSVF